MAEYINRQALLRFLNDIWLTTTPNDFMPDDDRHLAMVRCMGLNDAMDAVKSIPAADVRTVVLCRDCKHSEPWYSDKLRCFLWNKIGIDVFNDGFCNYGERRKERYEN